MSDGAIPANYGALATNTAALTMQGGGQQAAGQAAGQGGGNCRSLVHDAVTINSHWVDQIPTCRYLVLNFTIYVMHLGAGLVNTAIQHIMSYTNKMLWHDNFWYRDDSEKYHLSDATR